jgi:hypothetical protein
MVMGRRHSTLVAVRADEMYLIFDEKVAGERESTSDAPPPSLTVAPLD